MMVASTCAAMLNIALNMVFIPQFGYMAAAYTTLFCYIAYTLFHYVVMRIVLYKETGLKSVYNDSAIFMLSLALVAVSVVLLILYDHIIIRYLTVMALIIVLVYNREKIIKVLKQNKKEKDPS